MSTPTEYQRVAAELAALRAGIEALADEWHERGMFHDVNWLHGTVAANRLRNILDADS